MKTFKSLCWVAMLFSLSIAVHAEKPKKHGRHDPVRLDAIEVTSSPLRPVADELTEPVAVLADEELDDRRGATLGETVSSLPGVQSSNFGAGVGRPIIRGLEGARVAVLAGGLSTQDVSTVSQDHASAIEPFLADQIEVLKGPATLLFGSGAIGGAVNIVDGRIPETAPEATLTGRAEARWDSASDGHTGMFRVDGGGDEFALHADGAQRRHDDYRLPGNGRQRNSFVRSDSGALGASWIADWGFVGFSIAQFGHMYGNPGEADVLLDVDQKRYEAKSTLVRPLPGIDAVRMSFARSDYQHVEFEGIEVGTQFFKDADEGRIELTHEEIGEWTGALGVQLAQAEFRALGEEAFVPETRTVSRGVFLVEQRRWERLQLELGLRLDDVRSDPVEADARHFDPLSVSVGAVLELSERWNASFNLDHAERAPVEEELFATGPHVATAAFEIGDRNLRVEAANQAELGVQFRGERVEAKVSAYDNHFDDFIFLADTGEIEGEGEEALPIRQWSQRDARFRGIEAEAVIKLADSALGEFALRLTGDRVRGTFGDGGSVPRLAPARLGSELRWAREGWRASLGLQHYFRQDEVAINESPTAGYTLANAGAAYHWDVGDLGWELFIDARNLGDQEARVHTSYLKDRVVLPGRGFSVGLRAFF